MLVHLCLPSATAMPRSPASSASTTTSAVPATTLPASPTRQRTAPRSTSTSSTALPLLAIARAGPSPGTCHTSTSPCSGARPAEPTMPIGAVVAAGVAATDAAAQRAEPR